MRSVVLAFRDWHGTPRIFRPDAANLPRFPSSDVPCRPRALRP